MCKIEEISSTSLNDYIKPYWQHYDKGIKKIFQKKILPQLRKLWDDTKQWMMVYRHFEIDTNPMMEFITRILFFVYRTNKQIISDRKEYQRIHRTKQRKLNKLRTTKLLYKT